LRKDYAHPSGLGFKTGARELLARELDTEAKVVQQSPNMTRMIHDTPTPLDVLRNHWTRPHAPAKTRSPRTALDDFRQQESLVFTKLLVATPLAGAGLDAPQAFLAPEATPILDRPVRSSELTGDHRNRVALVAHEDCAAPVGPPVPTGLREFAFHSAKNFLLSLCQDDRFRSAPHASDMELPKHKHCYLCAAL
jgi:hypothetical protein